MFFALGNDRPQILVQLEDYVLHAVVDISEGKATEDAIDALYSQIKLLQEGLTSDIVASNWFNLGHISLSLDTLSDQDTAAHHSFEDNFQG
jgi:hypothetical protein